MKIYKVTKENCFGTEEKGFFTSHKKAINFIEKELGEINVIIYKESTVIGSKTFFTYKEYCEKWEWEKTMNKNFPIKAYGNEKKRYSYSIDKIEVE